MSHLVWNRLEKDQLDTIDLTMFPEMIKLASFGQHSLKFVESMTPTLHKLCLSKDLSGLVKST